MASDLPTGLVDPSGLVEQATLWAGERKRLIRIELAPLGYLVSPGFSADIVAAIIVDRHPSIMPHGSWLTVAW